MINEEIDESTDGPDLIAARRALKQAEQSKPKTDRLVVETRAALASLKGMHDENHFVEKVRLIMRGA